LIKITRLDLDYILTQIEMAEAGQPPVNPLLSFGLREVAGTNNNLVAGQSTFGASGQPFPTLTTPILQNAQFGTSYAQTTPGLVIDATPRTISMLIASQNAVAGAGADKILGTADDVFVSGNAAAFAAQQRGLSFLGAGYQNYTLPGADGIYGTADDTGTTFAGPDGVMGTADDITTFGNLATPMKASASGQTIPGLAQSLFIPNVTPDNGLSAPFNSFFTFFGQFFDHGLDKITTNSLGGNSFVFIPLAPDDPLYNPATPGNNFMVETRAQNLPGPDGILGTADDVHSFTNGDTPFVDQSQTYASDPSHQVFLRAYQIGADGNLHSTGALLGHIGIDGLDSMATWAELVSNAATKFGIQLTDYDVANVPLLATDAYGNFIPGAHGLPQLVVRFADGTQGLVEGNLTTPVGLGEPGDAVPTDPVTGQTYHAILVGNAFINDMAQGASPFDPQTGAPLAVGTFNSALLGAHYVAGDGRVNENIGLTAIQNIFHSEHDRILATIKALVQSNLDGGDTGFATNWVLPGTVLTPGVAIADNQWNGERLFQAAKFGTETEYQHIVFEEFARMVAPSIHVAGGVNVHLDPAITSEFANVVYRFGHSMLDENLNLYVLGTDGKPVIGANGQPQMTAEGLIQAFTNPLQFASTPNATADIVLGTVNQVGNEIDEFVTGTLQNNLLGQPLDLAALNIARGRDTGVAPLNEVRNQLFSQTGETQLKPYVSWVDFGSQLKHIESLVNFVAAYGTHSTITGATTMVAKLAAANALVANGALGSATFDIDAYNFMNSLGAYASNTLDARALHDSAGVPAIWSTGSVTGVDNIDMWIGGLAEKQSLFGGVLGSTFEYVFRTQMEALQDADRLYYLPRIEGTDYEESLQDSSLAQLVRANTNIKHLPGNIFQTPEYTIESGDYFVKDPTVQTAAFLAANPLAAGGFKVDAGVLGNGVNGQRVLADPTGKTWLHNPQTGALLVNATTDGKVVFIGDNNLLGNDIVLGGTEGNDNLTAGASDGDTLWGDGGNDTLDGGGGADYLFGGLGNDTLYGGQGDDIVHGDEGNDTIYGGDGIDTIFGGDGNDYIQGGRGSDIIMGGLGNDIILGNEGFDELTGDEGDDWLDGSGGQGQLMFGDSGAPTGGLPLYSGNDVMIGGIAGGDIMKGFNGDDIMLGNGSFTKFIGGLGWDWGSYENATQGVDADMNRKEFIAPNGLAADSIRDIWQHTEGASGSAFDDIIQGDDASRLLATKDELDNVNLITGLASFFAPGLVSFDGGNIILGGGGNDSLKGGGGNDIIDGDAFLHVALTSQTANSQIIRQISYDPNGNTYDPSTARFTLGANGLVVPGTFIAGIGHVNAANVDTAVYSDVMSNYTIAAGGRDAEGFLTITQNGASTIVGGNPQGLLGGSDGTDRIRNIERLQFIDETVAIDSTGKIISTSLAMPTDPNYATLYAPFYDAVPVGTPTLTESGGLDPATTVTVGQTLTASVATVADYDKIASPMTYQWQENDLLRGVWVDINGATGTTFTPGIFQNGALGIRVQATYIDGKGYKETVTSASTAAVTLQGNVNTAPTIVFAQQFTGIGSTTALMGAPFDYFSPFTAIFTDQQTASNALLYSATLADGSSLASVGLTFSFNPVTGAGEFSAPLGFVDPTGLAISAGQIAIRVTATDNGPGTPLSVTNTFFIDLLPLDTAPTANNDAYSILESATLAVTSPALGVLANDTDPDLNDRLTAHLVTGPAHGTLQLHLDGTFNYTPTLNFFGTDTFTYVADDIFLKQSNVATATITVTPRTHALSAALVSDTGVSATDGITNNPTLAGLGFANAAVFAAVDGAAPVLLTTASALVSGAWSGVPVLTDGFHTILISETDGVTGATDTATVSFTLDTIAPFVSAALVSDTGTSATDGVTSNPALTGVSDPNSTVSISVDGAAAIVVATNATGLYSFTPVVTDGTHTVVVTGSTDIAGNVGKATLAFTVDRIAPAVTEALFAYTGASATDKVTNNDRIIGSGDPNAAVFASIDGAAAVQVATADATGAWTFTPVLADGNHTVAVRETDLAGNTAAASVTFTLDTVPPPVTVKLVSDTGISATDGITKVSTITGTGDPSASVQVTVDGVLAGSIVTNATGIWNFAPVVADGTHTVSVTGTDLAGNSKTAALAFILDTAAPAAPTIGGFTYNTTATALTNYTLSGTAEAGSTVILTNNGATIGTVTASATGAWTVAVTPNPAINLRSTLTVTSTDAAGNVSASQSAGLIVGSTAVDTAQTNATAAPFATLSNLILGLGGNDTLTGGSGNDTLDGGTGSDAMSGGLGNDTYVLDAAGDSVTENANAGTDTVLTTLTTFTLGNNVENLTYTGAAAFAGTGNTLANVITGGAGADTLTGGTNTTGVDTLIGAAGSDIYIVSNAGDVIVEAAGGGTDTVRTALGSYTLGANLENLTYTGAGNFAGTGNSLANTITGGAGNDILDDGLNTAGVDTLIGGAGNDTYIVRNAGDVITDTNGTDAVQTTLNTFSIAGNTNLENLTFIGTGNFNGTGNSVANVITGGTGNDTLTGGQGADTFTINAAFGKDIISDFTAGAGNGHDVLNFASTIFANFTAMQAAATQVVVGGVTSTLITSGANTLTLTNVTKASLVAVDFTTH
jgi:Ca2+-binding RTX toxin-like protein